MNKNHEELIRDIEYNLSGTGCSTVGELRMAFDHLKQLLYVKHGDLWDTKRIAKTVSENMYKLEQPEIDGT
jgi:hypothetical protein